MKKFLGQNGVTCRIGRLLVTSPLTNGGNGIAVVNRRAQPSTVNNVWRAGLFQKVDGFGYTNVLFTRILSQVQRPKPKLKRRRFYQIFFFWGYLLQFRFRFFFCNTFQGRRSARFSKSVTFLIGLWTTVVLWLQFFF